MTVANMVTTSQTGPVIQDPDLLFFKEKPCGMFDQCFISWDMPKYLI